VRFISYFIVAFILISLSYGLAVYCALCQDDASSPQMRYVVSPFLTLIGFPFMDFWTAFGGVQLKRYVGDFGALILFTVLDITGWACLAAWLATRYFGRKGSA
jgi:hypothetical protein